MSTMKDVAKLAGVSTSTVSRTLTNRIFVEEETRQRVLWAVEQLGYRPNMMARGLKEGKTNTIAFLVPDINSLFYPEMMKSVERKASELGYSIILCNNDEDLAKEKRTLHMLSSRGIDGILCMSVSDDISHLIAFQQEYGIPVVLVNREGTDSISGISIDNRNGSYRMTNYLLEQGHRKIGGMFGNLDRKRFRDRLEGFHQAMAEAGISGYDRFVSHHVSTVEEAYHKAQQMLAQEDHPTAFFASMDILAIGIYRAANEKGLRIPEDISVAGFDNVDMAQYMMPPLTTYAIPIEKLAEESISALLIQLEDPERQSNKWISGELIERRSTSSQ